MELILSREIANDRIFPALNIKQSGTRKEELLIEEDKLKNIFVLRKIINDLNNKDALEYVLNIFKKHKTNEKMFKAIEKQKI